jgi:hypothetical protein
MSFTDGKPRIATEKECQAPWGGVKGGKRFRCYLCGHRFRVGDQYRWVYTNSIPGHYDGNPMVCVRCDGDDVVERWKARCDEMYSGKNWWFTESD